MKFFWFVGIFFTAALTISATTWTGNLSTDWSSPGNWSPMGIPDGTTDAVIPYVSSGVYPDIQATPAYCRDLTIQPNASLTISSATLYTSRDTYISGLLRITSNIDWFSYGSVYWQNGATEDITDDNSEIYCAGDMVFASGSQVTLTHGYIEFNRSGANAQIINHSTWTSLNNVRSMVASPHSLVISAASTEDIVIFGSIFNYENHSFICDYSGTTHLSDRLWDFNSGSSGGIKWNQGTLSTNGMTVELILPGPASYLNNLTVSTVAETSISADLTLKGDLTIDLGIFDPGGWGVFIGGSWFNNAGEGGFASAGSNVTFNGSGIQRIANGENFHTLTLNKSGGYLSADNPGTVITCQSYDWIAGTLYLSNFRFIALDMADEAILGDLRVNGCQAHFYQDSAAFLDIQGSLHIYSGELHLHGGQPISRWFNAGAAEIELVNGLIQRHGGSIFIYNTANPLTENIIGGTIMLDGSFLCNRPDFHPSGGRIAMTGSANTYINVSAGTPFNLYIEKTSSTASVTLAGDLSLTLTLNVVSGVFDLGGHTLTAAGSAVIHGTLRMQSATDVITARGFLWNEASVAVISLGSINCAGGWTVLFGADVQLPPETSTRLCSLTGNEIAIMEPSACFGDLSVDGLSGGVVYSISPLSTQDMAVSGDLTIAPGNELDLALMDLNVTGNLILSGKLDIHSVGAALGGKPVFSSGSWLSIDGGSFSFLDSNAPNTTYLNGRLDLLSGMFNAANHILCANAGSVNNIQGGIIDCDGLVATPSGTWQPTGGVLQVTETIISNLAQLNIGNGNWLQNVLVRHPSGGALMNGDLLIKQALVIEEGVFFLGAHQLRQEGNILVMDGGALDLTGGSALNMADGTELTVQSGGTFETIGFSHAAAQIFSQDGYFSLTIQSGGLVRAKYTEFRNLDALGVNLLAGALVEYTQSFHNCTFSDGYPGGTLLSLNTASYLTIADLIFPPNTWGGASNVSKTDGIGIVHIAGSSGLYAGDEFEQDPDNRVFWTTPTSTPDLIVAEVAWLDTPPQPYIGDTRRIMITVINSCTEPTGPFRIHTYYNQPAPPIPGQDGDMQMMNLSVNPNAFLSAFFNVSPYLEEQIGLWHTYVQVDPLQEVSETDESNNIFGPVNILWRDLPEISDLQAAIDPGSGMLLLDWTYPLEVSGFKVYHGANPEGEYNFLGFTTDNHYGLPPGSSRRFFRVSALRQPPD